MFLGRKVIGFPIDPPRLGRRRPCRQMGEPRSIHIVYLVLVLAMALSACGSKSDSGCTDDFDPTNPRSCSYGATYPPGFSPSPEVSD